MNILVPNGFQKVFEGFWQDNWSQTSTYVTLYKSGALAFIVGRTSITDTPTITGTGLKITIPSDWLAKYSYNVLLSNFSYFVSGGQGFLGSLRLESESTLHFMGVQANNPYLGPIYPFSNTDPAIWGANDYVTFSAMYELKI